MYNKLHNMLRSKGLGEKLASVIYADGLILAASNAVRMALIYRLLINE